MGTSHPNRFLDHLEPSHLRSTGKAQRARAREEEEKKRIRRKYQQDKREEVVKNVS